MEIKTTYIAFDGKEFNDEDLCLDYENHKKYSEPLRNARFYNFKGQEISINDYIADGKDMVGTVVLPTIEAIKSFQEIESQLNDNYEVSGITEPGLYFYEDSGGNYWHTIEEFPYELANYYNNYRIARKIKEQLDNEN